jgi:hypothetical protein
MIAKQKGLTQLDYLEAVDRVWVILSNLDDYVCSHAAVTENVKLEELANTIFEDMYKLYQALVNKLHAE